MPEYIDIYDADRNKTGLTLERAGARLEPGQYMLYALAVIEDLQGRLLITRRALDKRWAAGWWEVSGGGALAGETGLQAALREAREEVGLDLEGARCELLYSYRNDDAGGDNYFADIYRFVADFTLADVVLQEHEAVACRLATWDEVAELHEQGVFLHFSRLEKALFPERR